jgi:hypothetical protein
VAVVEFVERGAAADDHDNNDNGGNDVLAIHGGVSMQLPAATDGRAALFHELFMTPCRHPEGAMRSMASRRMATGTELKTILRDAASRLLRMTLSILVAAGM